MNDPQIETTQPEQMQPPMEPEVSASDARRRKTRRIVLIAVALIIGLCLCVVICVAVAVTGGIKAATERGPIERVIDEFMQAMAKGDTDTAYALLSSRGQRKASRAQLDELLQGNNAALFDGYKGVEVSTLNLTAQVETNPDLPQGTVANVSGTISYEGAFTGRFEAVLEKENEQWMLFGIHISVPPDKIGN